MPASLPTEIEIVPVATRKHFREFLRLPYSIYKSDPRWVPPLRLETRQRLDSKQNPYYRHAEVRLFLAKKDGRVVGRISAQVDREYEKKHGEKVGHWGFFESEPEPEVARALLNAAEGFFRERGAKRSQGPFSFSIHQECGLLAEGFEQPPMLMLPYNPPHYLSLVENCGYAKAKDLYSWWYQAGEVPEGPAQIAAAVAQYPGLVVRRIDKKKFSDDFRTMMGLYNEIWRDNWGFVPMTEEEIRQDSQNLRWIIDPEIAYLAELDGKAIAVCLCVPNVFEYIHDLKGRLLPFGFAKFAWRLLKKKHRSARLMLLGVKKEFRGSVLGGLSVLLYAEVGRLGYQAGYVGGELGWTLEDNHKINAGIEFMGGKKVRTFRIYEKNLS